MQTVLKYYIRVVMLLFPVFFLPVVISPFGFGKNWFLIATALVGLVLWVVGLLMGKKNEVRTNKPFFFVLFLVVWAAVTFFRETLGVKTRSLMDPMGLGTWMAVLIWLFLWLQVTDKEEQKAQFNYLTIAGVIVAISSLITFMIPTNKLPLVWPKDNPLISIGQGFSLTGSLLGEAIFILFLVYEWIRRLVVKLKDKESIGYVTEALAVGVFGLVLLLDVYKIFKLGWGVLDGYSSWVIATETLKRSPIFGVGIGNFIEGFNILRPASFNLTKYWSSAFSGSSMGVLQVWTELGIVGLFLLFLLVSNFLKQKKNHEFFQVGLMFLIFLVLPMNLITVFLLAWVLGTRLYEKKETKLILNVGEKNFNAMPLILSVLLVSGALYSSYLWGRYLWGEIVMRNSLVAAAKNDGVNTYNLQIKAIAINPNLADYRKIYSQTNLALAQNILSDKDVSEENKQKASTLIQQAVREGKAAITLEGNNVAYWSNLAVIYRALAGVVDGAADWSFQAYQQAVVLDPVNPMLKLDLGGLLYAANRFDEADRIFEQVVAAKNDFPNGWYNWAYTAKQNNRLADAVSRLTQALALVPKDSGDYEKAQTELATWQKELDAAVAKAKAAEGSNKPKEPETLKTAEPLPTVGQEEKVNVPAEELQPPVTSPANPVEEEVNPTPEAAPVSPTQTIPIE